MFTGASLTLGMFLAGLANPEALQKLPWAITLIPIGIGLAGGLLVGFSGYINRSVDRQLFRLVDDAEQKIIDLRK